MTKQEYENYQQRVANFFKREGITNLSRIDNESEPYFSWSSCDCCRRSSLAGDRIDASGYNPTTKDIQEYSICIDCEYYAEYGQLDDMTMIEIGE